MDAVITKEAAIDLSVGDKQLVADIEAPLQASKKAIDDEKARVKREAEEAKQREAEAAAKAERERIEKLQREKAAKLEEARVSLEKKLHWGTLKWAFA